MGGTAWMRSRALWRGLGAVVVSCAVAIVCSRATEHALGVGRAEGERVDGPAGERATLRCDDGVVGLIVTRDAASGFLSSVALECAGGRRTRTAGSPAGPPTTQACRDGQRAAGVYGRRGALMDAVGVVCRAPGGGARRGGAVGNTRGGSDFQDVCRGEFTGLTVRHADFVRDVLAVCDEASGRS